MTKELIEELEHKDELSGDLVWEAREALKKQAIEIDRLTAELAAMKESRDFWKEQFEEQTK